MSLFNNITIVDHLLSQCLVLSVRSGQIKNSESARVSMAGQLKPCDLDGDSKHQLSPSTNALPTDTIAEGDEDQEHQSSQTTAARHYIIC